MRGPGRSASGFASVARLGGSDMEGFQLSDYGAARVAAVVPARNEEPSVGDVVAGARRYVHEVVLMDGHSTDGTADVARRAGATVHRDPGRGKGSAIRYSLEVVEADVLVFIDGDGSHDPADIPRLARPVTRGEVQLCVGDRFAGGSEELSISFGQLIRTVGNISMNVAINLRWGTELADTLNGFRAVDRHAARTVELTEDRHTIEQEMVMKMLRHGYDVRNVPAHEYPRKHGESHIRVWREWPRFVWCVAKNLLRRDRPRPSEQFAADHGGTGLGKVVGGRGIEHGEPTGGLEGSPGR